MQGSQPKNILVVRTDRIGDVVLTLPVVDVLRKAYPESRISFLARTYTRDLLIDQEGIASVICYDDERLKAFGHILSELRQLRFDLAVVAYPRFRIALLLWLAGVKTRLGTGYRWYSMLFNKRVYEHRKTAEKHELDYNLSLLRHLGIDVPETTRPTLSIPRRSIETAESERQRLQLSDEKPVAILHPGSGGSARDWSPENFCALAGRLSELGFQVVVTGARGEESLVNRVVNGMDKIRTSVGRLGLKELAAFIKRADLFISNSTGPLHMAAAVGTPVIGFYPPILACSPERWGPVTDSKIVFVPDPKACPLCKGGPCRANVCMEQIRVDQVVDAARQLVRGRVKQSLSQVHP